MDIKLVKFYNKLMEDRSDADYSPSVIFEESGVGMLKDLAAEFNEAIIKLIDKV